jgi:E3 ubiquitin-protein ligase listerin
VFKSKVWCPFNVHRNCVPDSQSALQTSLAISLAVIEVAPEPSRLDRYRNELASKLSGVPPSKANTTGFRLLRCLSAVAPDPESDVIFLPQQRAVFVVQTLQAWMGSDEDLEERVESEVTLMLFNLVPILQSIQGAHWDFILDLIESNIEVRLLSRPCVLGTRN